MGYKFANAESGMSGNSGQADYLIVEIDEGVVKRLYDTAIVTQEPAYSWRDPDKPELEEHYEFKLVRINGAHVDSMKVHPYAELHVWPNGQVSIAVEPFPYTIGLHEDHYDGFGLPTHDHLAW